MTGQARDHAFAYWAKSERGGLRHHSVISHSIDVAAVCAAILDMCPQIMEPLVRTTGLERSWLRARLPVLVGLHDIGKLSPRFQMQRADIVEQMRQGDMPQARRYNMRHDALGQLLWEDHLASDVIANDPLFLGLKDLDRSEKDGWIECLNVWAKPLFGHHGAPPELVDAAGLPVFIDEHFSKVTLDDASHHIEELSRIFIGHGDSGNRSGPPTPDQAYLASWIIAGLAVLSDWLGSSEEHFPLDGVPEDPAAYYESKAKPAAARAVEASGLIPVEPAESMPFQSLFEEFEPTPLQTETSGLEPVPGPHLFIIEDLTGSGKTEAALTLMNRLMGAGQAAGFYFALPTMATSNAMYGRIGKDHGSLFNGSPSVVLAHGQRDLNDGFAKSVLGEEAQTESDGLPGPAFCTRWLADHRKKALLAQLGVGTVDQALLSILPVRHQSLRMAGLLGKILVVDEVHAYDTYTGTLLQGLIRFHASMGGSTILLSATLPSRTKQGLVQAYLEAVGSKLETSLSDVAAYPCLTHVHPGGGEVTAIGASPRSHRTLSVERVQPEGVVDRILESAADGRCVVWIRNTVRSAMEAYDDLRARCDPDLVQLFHARYTQADRARIEEDITRRFGPESGPSDRAGRILVATQVVEQSLDLDFDEMFTDLAPIDLILQRAGRLQRHTRDQQGARLDPGDADQRPGPTLHIVGPDPTKQVTENWVRAALPGTAAVYPDHGALWVTITKVGESGKIQLPRDARPLVEHVYGPDGDAIIPDALQRAREQTEGEAMVHRSISLANQLRIESGYHRGNDAWEEDTFTPTRLGEPTITLRLALQDGSEIVPMTPAGRDPWQGTQVSVRSPSPGGVTDGVAEERLVARARPPIRDHGPWSRTVLLEETPDHTYCGTLQPPDGDPVRVLYSTERGLVLERT